MALTYRHVTVTCPGLIELIVIEDGPKILTIVREGGYRDNVVSGFTTFLLKQLGTTEASPVRMTITEYENFLLSSPEPIESFQRSASFFVSAKTWSILQKRGW